MIDTTTAQVGTPTAAPATRRLPRIALVVAGLALAATLATGAAVIFGGEQVRPVTDVPAFTGDRDSAWLESLDRQAAYNEQRGSYYQTPVHDKEEGLRQAEERRAEMNR